MLDKQGMNMQEIATLLQAISALLWPVLTFVALLMFRSQISDIAKRLKKGKLLGQEIELSESLNKLSEAAEIITHEVAELPIETKQIKSSEELANEMDIVRKIIGEAGRSPKAALIMLAAEIEKFATEFLATTGNLRGRRTVSIRQAIQELHQSYGLPSHVPSSLEYFWEIRNRLIHKGEGGEEEILRAIDSGISILKALQSMPREINIVFEADVPIYYDPELKNIIPNVKGVILETYSTSGVSKSYSIFPTTRNYTKKGKEVSWEWNMELVTGEAWYFDKISNENKQAWSSAAEFVGRYLEEL